MMSGAAPSNRPLRRQSTGLLFASPWLAGFALLTVLPVMMSLALSLTQWNGINLSQVRFVGLDNYERAWNDPDVSISLWNTFYYAFVSVPLGLAVALGLAILLNQKLPGIPIFRTIFYMPHVVGGVATIMMWLWVFNPDFGLLNSGLRGGASVFASLGVIEAGWTPPRWLYDPFWSKPALIVMSVWGSGGAMLIFLAALQGVSADLYEAAHIDGAGPIRRFWNVTVPQISPAIFFNLVMGIIGAFQVFEQAYILTQGGPSRSTLFFVLHLYNKAFQDFEMGYASALAWVLFVIILLLTLLVVRSSKAWVHYEGDDR